MSTIPSEAPAVDGPGPTVWQLQWRAVPKRWRTTLYPIAREPFSQVFIQIPPTRTPPTFDVTPADMPQAADELSWAVYTIWREGLGRINPTHLRQFAEALASLHRRRSPASRRPSIGDWRATDITHEADLLFQARNGHLWNPHARRRFTALTERIHLLVATRCASQPWWRADTWSLVADPRIPRREHEPLDGTPARIGTIRPRWLREGMRYWLSTALTYQMLTWSTVVGRISSLGPALGAFAEQHGLTSPLLTGDPRSLRSVTAGLAAWLHEPRPATGTRRKPGTIAAIQTSIQSFYRFMYDHADDAAAATGNPDWGLLTADYTRLWPPEARLGRSTIRPENTQRWLSRDDLQQMVACLPILAGPTGQPITVDLPGGRSITVAGHGDPEAVRAWLLQAMTGRRKSEILLLDFNPLIPLDGIDPDTAADNDTFVARLRYQQTKIDNVDATILVERAVVHLIREQQAWVTARIGHAPKYLFVALRENLHGDRPRDATSFHEALHRLDASIRLTDAAGKPLRFTQTHRLRHTRATELINAGVPIHVVQRYLGHRSPEMTMRYAATLASVAESEFLRYKQKVGADGRDLGIDPKDLYEMAQLDTRTDRILPNGYCILPPTQSCGRGNACLSCGHFATDASQLPDLTQQLDDTRRLIRLRQQTFTARHGQPMGPGHIWLVERTREVSSLEAIIARLDDTPSGAVQGAGTTGRKPGPPETDGAHQTLLANPAAQDTP